MSRVPLRALASALGTSLVLLALLPALDALAQESRPATEPHAHAAGGMDRHEWTGSTRLVIEGVCPERSPCLGENRTDPGTFFLATGGDGGTVTLTWRAVDPSLAILRVRVAEAVAEGGSPLVLEVGSLPAGTYPVEVETIQRVAGRFDQSLAWTASFYLVEPADRLTVTGVSSFKAAVACLAPLGCDPLLDDVSSVFHLPWTADGELGVAWDAKSRWTRELRVSVDGTSLVAEGASPLHLEVHGLPPGEYAVRVTPLTAPAGATQSVSWSLVARPAT